MSSRTLREALSGTLLSALILLLCVSPAGATDKATAVPGMSFELLVQEVSPGARVMYLSLEDCIASAIESNLDIQVERYSPRIGAASVQSEKGVFDPHVYLNATYVDRTDPLPTRASIATGGLTAVETERWILTGGVTGAIPTGLVYDANIVSEHTPFSTVTDFLQANGEHRFETTLTLTQPLLKNFGIGVNTTGIQVAVKEKEASVYQLEQRILETVFEVEQAYWELVFAYENLRVKMRSLQVAEDLLEENRVRLRVGVLAPLAVLQSEAGVAFREEEYIVARSEVQDAKDRLIKVTNLLSDQLLWDIEIIPTDVPTGVPPDLFEEAEQITVALQSRPELKQLLKQQEAAKAGARFAKNQLLPNLDLSASIGLVGLSDDYDASFFPAFFGGLPLPPSPDTGVDPAWDDLFSGDNLKWTLGIRFEFPWGNRAERGRYKSANLLVSQVDSTLLSTRQLIIQDTRKALRDIRTNWKRVVSTRETTRFRRESLKAEQKKFEVGVSTAHDLLEFEEELAEAEANERRAAIDYTVSLSNLLRATGVLLDARNVRVASNP